eukprot:12754907-Alexandrium_andersonii.AAC.1
MRGRGRATEGKESLNAPPHQFGDLPYAAKTLPNPFESHVPHPWVKNLHTTLGPRTNNGGQNSTG